MGLIVNNPMLAEMQREKNKALAEHNWRGGQLAARILLGVIYLSILAMLLYWIEIVEPVYLMYVLLMLETIMIPAALHGTIAGDREKRSFDMLLVAPLSAGQIVVGKFSRGFVTIMGLALAIGLPALVVQIVKLFNGSNANNFNTNIERNGFVGFVVSFVFCVAAGLAMGSMTIWISSKTRSNSAAMLSTIGALFLVLIVAPFIAAIMETFAPTLSEFIVQMNPFVGLASAYSGEEIGYNQSLGSSFYTVLSIMIYSAATVFFLTLATGNVYAMSRGRIE